MKTPICILFCLLLAACQALSPDQKSRMHMMLDDSLRYGEITQAQHDAAIEAIDNDKPFDWEGLGFVGLNMLLALLGGPMVVRTMRGPPTQKVGLPSSMIQPPAPPQGAS